MRDITIGANIQNTFFFFNIGNRWKQAWTRVLWKTPQRFSSTSTKWARTNFSVLSILCGASLKMTNIFEADVCGSFDCTSSSSLRSRQLWARACKFVTFPLKVFFITHQTYIHVEPPLLPFLVLYNRCLSIEQIVKRAFWCQKERRSRHKLLKDFLPLLIRWCFWCTVCAPYKNFLHK